MQKMFSKKPDLDFKSNALKFDTTTNYITVIDWLVGDLLMAQLFYHV